MEHLLKLFSTAVLVISTAWATDCPNMHGKVSPYIYNRSVSQNAARELAGWTGQVNQDNRGTHYGSFSITPEYTHSFSSGKIAHQLFNGNFTNCCGINIVGSAATTAANGATDWLADYFYLPTSYKGGFSVNPVIQNALVDLNLYWGMDEWAHGLFFRIHAPITWTQWNLSMCMNQETPGTNGGIVTALLPANTLKNFLDFSCYGVKPQDRTVETTTYTFTPLYYSKLCSCSQSKTSLSDLQIDFGGNFVNNEAYHLGLFARAVAPTGTRPQGELLFEPMIGNGKNWEIGGGVTAHIQLWRSEEQENEHCGLYVDANITHFFNAKQCRFFDLCNNGSWSRYNLAFKTTTQGTNTTFTFCPVANLTAHAVKVSSAVQADVAALLNYTNGNYSFDLGYNFWARTCEKFDSGSCEPCKTSCSSGACPSTYCASCDSCSICNNPTFYNELDGKTWSLAGANSAPLSAANAQSYSQATIHAQGPADAIGSRIYLKQSNVNINGGRTKGLSNKVFTHFAYNWYDRQDWIPYLGIGGEVEFGGGKSCCTTRNANCNACCSSCTNTAISQWGLWIKGGVSF